MGVDRHLMASDGHKSVRTAPPEGLMGNPLPLNGVP